MTRERSIRTEGVILRHSNFGEADRLLTVFTRQLGKVRVIAKGVRKAKSRKAGHVQPFSRAQMQLARGRDLWILTQAEASEVYPALRGDLVLLGYASYVIELLDRFTYEEGEHRALFDLLTRTLTRLNRGDPPEFAVRYYEMRLLDQVGFRPRLFACAQCGAEIQPEDQYFSASQGGVLCPRCGIDESQSRPIHVDALKYLRHFQRSSYSEARRAQIPPAVAGEMEALMQYYLTYNLERGLNSAAFLRRMRAEGQ